MLTVKNVLDVLVHRISSNLVVEVKNVLVGQEMELWPNLELVAGHKETELQGPGIDPIGLDMSV